MASVDVVVPNYQYGRYLATCVGSVLSQDVDDLRVLIIDNASTDDSAEVARRLGAEDSRVEVVVHRRNLGQHASFNEGIDWAAADCFLILCSDDMLAPGALRRAVACLAHDPEIDLTWGRTVSIAADGEPPPLTPDHPGAWTVRPGRALLEDVCRSGRNPVPGPTAVVRTAAQKRAGYYRHHLPQTDDLEMWMRIAAKGSVASTEAVQGVARVHALSQSAGARTVLAWDQEFLAAFDSFFAFEGRLDPDARRLHRMARRSLAARAYWCSLSSLLRGEARLSRDLMTFALRQCPDMAVVPPLAALARRGDAMARIAATLAHAAAPVRRHLSLARPR